jgi:hypothetical protein
MRENEIMPRRSAEIEVLLRCVRNGVSGAASQHPTQLDAIPDTLDWPLLLSLAEQHGVLGIVYPMLAPYAPEEFAAAARANWAGSQHMACELESLLEIFARNSIDVLPLKGPWLAQTLYGDIAARQSADLDLLVRRSDDSRVEAILLEAGFNPGEVTGDGYHRSFYRNATMVELHVGLGYPEDCPLDTEGIWNRSAAATFHCRPIRVMNEDDLIFFLCYHMLKHSCARLIWIADLSRSLVLLRGNSAGESLLAVARIQGLESLLLYASALAQETLPTPIPSELAAAISGQPRIARIAHEFIELLLSGPSAPLIFPRHWIARAKTQRKPRQMVQRLNLLAPNIRDRNWAESHRIPGPLLVPFLPALRLLRLLHKYGFNRAWRLFAFQLRD